MVRKISCLPLLTLLVLAMLGCQKGMTTVANNSANNTANLPVALRDDAPRISLVDAKADFDTASAVFVDTRAEIAYKQEHIKGAINISGDQLNAKIGELPRDKKIIAYCS